MDIPKLRALDLFSGIGGISEALDPWIQTIAYCEADKYAQAVLLSRMERGELDRAPIWDDVRTLRGDMLPSVEIITGGFPCQDISVAGKGVGFKGERSSLFHQIIRLAKELRPSFVFLENVPAISSVDNGAVLGVVLTELAQAGYNCRYGILSAADMGAPHRRDRFWLLASNTNGSAGRTKYKQQPSERPNQSDRSSQDGMDAEDVAHAISDRKSQSEGVEQNEWRRTSHSSQDVAYSSRSEQKRIATARNNRVQKTEKLTGGFSSRGNDQAGHTWEIEPKVGRVVDGFPDRSNQLKCLGNSVVPQCAREAFQRLMGLT